MSNEGRFSVENNGIGRDLGNIKEANAEEKRWWKKAVILDVEEAKKQALLALPMIITNGSYYLVTLVSVMFAGHLGQLQLAGSTLANSWSFVTGFSFMVGISGALETLCGQGYGAKLYNMLGLQLQATCIISIFFSIMISIVWWFTEPILILLHQSPEISKEAAIYIRYQIPGLFAYGILQNILRFLQTQSIVMPLVICSLVPLALHIGLAYFLIHCTVLGFKGAPLATSITFWISVIALSAYVKGAKTVENTWKGLSKDAFRQVLPTLPLAVPSAIMVCLEFWAFEIMVLLAGLMPNSVTRTSVMAMCVNTAAIAFHFLCGLSAAVSTRVSNEIGANRPNEAKNALWANLKLTFLVVMGMILALGLGHNVWASLFSTNVNIIRAFASMTPFLCCTLFLDAIQISLLGVARGCGWQKFVVCINLGAYYLIALPIAVVLGFILKLYVKGLWVGIIGGLTCQSVAVTLVTIFRKWTAYECSNDGRGNSA